MKKMNKNNFRNSLNQFKSFFSRIPAIYMYVDEVDVLLNDSNKKNKEQFNSKQHKVNNITIYAEHEFQNLFRMIYRIMSLNDCNLIHMRACNIYNKIYSKNT